MDSTNKQDLKKHIEAAVKTVIKDYSGFLSFAARFYNYDINNLLLLYLQFPAASMVAGYTAWRNYTAEIKDQTPAILLSIPCSDSVQFAVDAVDEFGDVVADDKKQIQKDVVSAPGLDFKRIYAFDISQVNCDAEIKQSLSITVNSDELLKVLRRETGYALLMDDGDALQSYKNYEINHKSKDILIKKDINDVEKAEACIRALAEYKITPDHTLTDGRSTSEIEIQSVSYIVCSRFGLKTGNFSFPYIHSLESEPVESVFLLLERIFKAASDVIQIIDGYILTVNDIAILNCYLAPTRAEFVDILDQLTETLTDNNLKSSVGSLRNKIDMISLDDYDRLYRNRCEQMLYTIPVQYVKGGQNNA